MKKKIVILFVSALSIAAGIHTANCAENAPLQSGVYKPGIYMSSSAWVCPVHLELTQTGIAVEYVSLAKLQFKNISNHQVTLPDGQSLSVDSDNPATLGDSGYTFSISPDCGIEGVVVQYTCSSDGSCSAPLENSKQMTFNPLPDGNLLLTTQEGLSDGSPLTSTLKFFNITDQVVLP